MTLTPFTSKAQRKAVYATNPTVGDAIAHKHGAKVGGGFTKAQISRRRFAAGKGQAYKGAHAERNA